MVHRTHLDIFPYYYPEVFDNWWIDDWITVVYGDARKYMLPDWEVVHEIGSVGTRYGVDMVQERLLAEQVRLGGEAIQRYLEWREGH